MNINRKKFLSLIIVLAILCSALPVSSVTVFAAYENTYKNTGNQRADIIGVAETQIGYREGKNNDTKYGDWYGLPNQPWCAMFVSWCARKAGIPTSVLRNSSCAGAGPSYFNIPSYNGSSYTPKSGDLFFTKNWSHVGLVYSIDGNYFYTIEGNSNDSGSSEGIGVFKIRRKISDYYFGVPNYSSVHTHSYNVSFEAAHPHKEYKKCSCGKTEYTGNTKAYHKCSTCMKVSTAYPKPIKAYTIATGKTKVYDTVNGKAKSNKIYDTDLCTISQIYNCGWCKVSFPLDAGGTETGYCKLSVFMKSENVPINTSKQINTYRRSDLKTSMGYAGSGDKVYIIGSTSTAVQILYPLTAGGYKAGWIPISAIKSTISYNSNSGSRSMSNASVQYNGKFQLSANKFKKTGYSFNGWNVYRSSDKKWYVASQGWKTKNEINTKKYTKKLYKDKYSGTLSSPWISAGKTNDTYTFYAVWKANQLGVNYNANGGKITSDTYKLSNNLVCKGSSKLTQTWTYNSAKENGLCNVSTFGLTRDGYTFKGWGTTSSGGTIFDQNDSSLVPEKINSSIKTGNCTTTLYAIWTPKTYSVKYDANGGTGAPSAQTKTFGKVLILSNTVPKRSEHEFLGWARSKTAVTAEFKAGANYTSNSAVTLYAVWKENVPSITHTHEWNTDYTIDKEPTCTENGVKSIHCKTCNETKNSMSIPATGHLYEEKIVKEPTCAQKGEKAKCCKVCGDKVDKIELPMKEHKFVSTVTKEATCEKEGTMEDICSECSLHTNKETIPVSEHEFGEWVVEKEATLGSDGVESRNCLNCAYKETRTIDFIPVYNENAPQISVENIVAGVDEEVEVKIQLNNNPGITALRLVVDYDEEALTMTDFSFGDALSSMNKSVSEKYGSPYAFSMYSATKDLTDNGTLATIKFKVNKSITNGKYPINITYNADDIFNLEGKNVHFDTEQGAVTVDSCRPGDVNDDNEVNMRDVVLLHQAINGWEVSYNSYAADFNGDNKINMRDVVALSQYINN